MKIIPEGEFASVTMWKPVENESVDVQNWRW